MSLRMTKNPAAFSPDPRKRLAHGLFHAIGVVLSCGCMVSALKLLLSAVDTLAALDSNDGTTSRKRFRNWLDTYADLSHAGVTAEEVYSLRCSLLHTTTLESKSVRASKCAMLIPYKRPADPALLKTSSNQKPFEIGDLVDAITEGADGYCATLDSDPNARKRFDANAAKFVFDFFSFTVERTNQSP